MSTQSTVTDPENPSDSDESTTDCSSAYAELLSTSSLEELGEKGFEVKLALLQHHLQLARIFVQELLEEEVEEKAGQRHSHDRFSRWGSNPGSVRIGEEKVPVKVPRMIDTETEETCSPERYFQMKELPKMSDKMQEAILLGSRKTTTSRSLPNLSMDSASASLPLANGLSNVAQRRWRSLKAGLWKKSLWKKSIW